MQSRDNDTNRQMPKTVLFSHLCLNYAITKQIDTILVYIICQLGTCTFCPCFCLFRFVTFAGNRISIVNALMKREPGFFLSWLPALKLLLLALQSEAGNHSIYKHVHKINTWSTL